MKPFNIYLLEKLKINKNFVDIGKIKIPENIHITGNETRKNIIDTIKSYYDNKKTHKMIDELFSDIKDFSLDYCFYDNENDGSSKNVEDILPGGPDKYKDIAEECIELDEGNIDYLMKLRTTYNTYIIVWKNTERDSEYEYIFFTK